MLFYFDFQLYNYKNEICVKYLYMKPHETKNDYTFVILQNFTTFTASLSQ